MEFNTYKKTVFNTLAGIDSDEIDKLIELLVGAYYTEKLIFIIGNGGSAANASHFAQDLAKGTRTSKEQPLRLKALSLTDNSPFITAQGNDEGYESIFEQQLRTFAKPGDLLIAISGSGNSPNIIKAVEWANANKLTTIGITAFDGGKLKKLSNYSVNVALNDMCTSESIHSVIFHYVILEIRERLNK
ncbi:MAG: SIS domain-containing protein [Ignavibacteria bacterium]|jgi:D-sedoheptulose 7-phosphate isomerase